MSTSLAWYDHAMCWLKLIQVSMWIGSAQNLVVLPTLDDLAARRMMQAPVANSISSSGPCNLKLTVRVLSSLTLRRGTDGHACIVHCRAYRASISIVHSCQFFSFLHLRFRTAGAPLKQSKTPIGFRTDLDDSHEKGPSTCMEKVSSCR